jgi:spermidine synthase
MSAQPPARPQTSPFNAALAAGLVFAASAAVLVLELVSLRLIAPYLGLTLETNTAVIATALSAIAAGTWVGGRAADLVSPARVLGPLVLAAGVLVLLILPVVRWTGELVRGGDVSAVLVMASLALFAPAALLSAVTPMVVKLRLTTLAQTGTVVGRLSGLSTVGAIAGTVLTGFVFVAAVPTSSILLSLGAALVAVGAALTVTLRGLRAAALPMALAVLLGGATAFGPRPCHLETAYHCARVESDPERDSGRVLVLDTLRHSYVDLDDPTYLDFAYTEAIASTADVAWPAGAPVRAFHIGGGGVTLPRYLDAVRPGTRSTVSEIDEGVVDIDIERLQLQTGEGIDVEVEDARLGLAQQPTDSHDLVVGDAFGGVSVPWHLTTREVADDVQRVLVADGIYAMNVIDFPPLDFARAEVATLRAVFDHVAIAAEPAKLDGDRGGNLVLLASDHPLPVPKIEARLADRNSDYAVATGGDVAGFAGDARVLTDDFAPVDQMLTPYPPAASTSQAAPNAVKVHHAG